MASLDVKTAFDVVKPSVVSKIHTLTGVHGHLTAALLAGMQDVRGSACFEKRETEVRYPRCIRQGGVEALCCGVAVPNTYFGKLKSSGRPEAGGFDLAEYVLPNDFVRPRTHVLVTPIVKLKRNFCCTVVSFESPSLTSRIDSASFWRLPISTRHGLIIALCCRSLVEQPGAAPCSNQGTLVPQMLCSHLA